MTLDLDRRSFLRSLSGLLAAMALPQASIPCGAQPATLASVLGLRPDEETWLAELTSDEQQELHRALTQGQGGARPVAPRTIELLAKILGRRSHLFAFLDYPQVADTRSLCDGLMRE